MHKNTWKQAERFFASIFGSERTPLSGGNSKITRSDSMHDHLYLEHKHGKKHAIWSLFEETKPKADKEGKIPVLGIRKARKHGLLIVIHSDHLEEVLRLLKKAKQTHEKAEKQAARKARRKVE